MSEQPDSPAPLRVWWLAALVSAVPIAAVHAAFGLSVGMGRIPGGVPYVDGCTSISGACRQDPSIYLFRALVVPIAPALVALWWLVGRWLVQRGEASNGALRSIRVLGIVGALFMVLYATFLGTEGRIYDLLRRYGIYVFFGFTAIAELVLTLRFSKLARGSERALLHGMRGVCIVMAALGVANLFASNIYDVKRWENVIEWWFALVMMGFFGLLAELWRRDGLAVELAS